MVEQRRDQRQDRAPAQDGVRRADAHLLQQRAQQGGRGEAGVGKIIRLLSSDLCEQRLDLTIRVLSLTCMLCFEYSNVLRFKRGSPRASSTASGHSQSGGDEKFAVRVGELVSKIYQTMEAQGEGRRPQKTGRSDPGNGRSRASLFLLLFSLLRRANGRACFVFYILK